MTMPFPSNVHRGPFKEWVHWQDQFIHPGHVDAGCICEEPGPEEDPSRCPICFKRIYGSVGPHASKCRNCGISEAFDYGAPHICSMCAKNKVVR